MEAISEEKDRHRKVIALIICIAIGFLYVETVWKPYFYGIPQPRTDRAAVAPTPVAQPTPGAEFIEPDAPSVVPAGDPAALPASQYGYPADARLQQAGSVVVTTSTLRADISLLGGRMTSIQLRNYPVEEGKPELVDLVEHVEHAPYPLGVYSGGVNDASTSYELVESPNQSSEITLSAGDEAKRVVLRGTLPDGRQVTKTFTFFPDGYRANLDVALSAPAADGSRFAVEWTQYLGEDASSLLDPYNVMGFVWYDGQKVLRTAFKDLETNQQPLPGVHWVAVSDKYFVSSLFTGETKAPAALVKTGKLFRVRVMPGEKEGSVSLVLGPKRYEYLESIGYSFENAIDFGKFAIIAAPLLHLLHLLYGLLGNYGLAIVVLTILVKMCLFPLNSASFRQMKAMQDLKPEIDRIREQVKDSQQQQLELMALYKKRGVNPLGGCLPVLLQMPIFIGLYSALMLAVELRGANFALWITDLSAPERFMVAGYAVPVMVILFVLSMIVQQWTTPTSMDPTQKKVMMVMPLVMGFMFAGFPAGLTLYWLTNNLISIGQQKGLQRTDKGSRSAFLLTLAVSLSVLIFAWILTLL